MHLERYGHTFIRLATRRLTDYEKHSSLAPDASLISEHWDMVLFDGITGEANILAGLYLALNAIRDGGRVVVRFSEDDRSPRLPRWREFWLSVAERIGLTLTGRTESTLHLVRADTQPRWVLKLADETDTNAIRTLFLRVFQNEMPDALWQWKYGGGRGNAVLAYRDGELVAHYGGMFRSIRFAGKQTWALQAGDVMVHPSERGVFTRQGIFFLMTSTWAEMYGPLDFGFPNSRSMRLGEKLGIYASAGRMIEAHWSTTRQASERPPLLEEVRQADNKFADVTNRLWSAMCRDLPGASMGVRDWKWIVHRYIEHPTHRYEVMLLRSRWLRRPQGIIVLRRHDQTVEVMDIVAPIKAFGTLLRAACSLSNMWGKQRLFGWFCTTYFSGILPQPTEIIELDVEIPTDAWTKTEEAGRIIGTWWMTAGDTDFR